MSDRTQRPIDDELLAAFVEGELSSSERAVIEATQSEDPELRRRVAGFAKLRAALSEPIPELEGLDVTSAVRARIDAPDRSLSARARLFAGAGLAAAAAALVVAGLHSEADSAREFGVKGSSPALASAERWTAVQVHRVRGGAAPELVSTNIERSEGLLFSYTNRAEAPFEYLMIFGVDRSGVVYWFHPAYERLGENPRSTPIRRGVIEQVLPEIVRHDLPPGPLAIHALFTRRPLEVLAVEGWVLEKRQNPGVAAPGGGSLHRIELAVEP